MTQQPQQLKFGDRVRWGDDTRQFVYLNPDDAHPEAGWIHSEDGGQYLAAHSALMPVPHPDTERIDWLADPANKIGSVILPTECVEQHLDSMRDAIDAAMCIQAAEAV